MRTSNWLVALALLAVIGAAGCGALASLPGTPAVTSTADYLVPSGHWEAIHQIHFSDISGDDLDGDIGPAYRVYLVTMAAFDTDTYGLTIGPDDDVRYTLNGGQAWTRATGALFCRHGLDIVDEKVAWHCGNGGTRVSTNGGQTWKTVAPSACPYLSFLSAQSGWAASPYALQSTSDGGASWKTISLPAASQNIAALDLRTERQGFMLDTAGQLFSTTDGGLTWNVHSLGLNAGEQLLPASEGPKAVMRFADSQHGVVVFDLPDRTVWFAITSDGGRSWQRSEILQLRHRSYYYHLYLARSGRLLTVTDDFNGGSNTSIVLRYRQP